MADYDMSGMSIEDAQLYAWAVNASDGVFLVGTIDSMTGFPSGNIDAF
jgi:hypothetical protein